MDFEVCTKAPESWARMTIGDVCTRITSGGTPSRRTPEFFINGSVPWVKTQELQDGWIYATEELITEDAVKSSSAKFLPARTVLLAMYGATVGQLGVLASPMACNQACCALIIDDKIADFRYVYYLLLQHRDVIKSLATGAAQQNLSATQIKQFRFALPDRQAQGQIADVLSGLDDKIALNRRINQTLEAMAQAIFKSWFVDFDPVRAKIAAKQEGRDPLRAAMSAISGKPDAELNALPPEHYAQLAATAALFPEEMEESELGEIPRGWFVRTMPDCIEVNPARTLKKGTVAQYLDMANVPTNYVRVQNVVPREFASGSKFRNGDTLLARITPCFENGKTAFVDFLNGDEVGWGSTEFIVLRPKNGLPEQFAYFLCRHPDFRAFAIAQMAGTSGRQRVPNDCFGGYKLVEPAEPVAIEFGSLAGAALDQIKALDKEAKTLKSLRDTLLPKLLSGELSVAALSDEVAHAV